MDIEGYWNAVLRQDAGEMRKFFHPDAYVNWHNTDEHFTVEEFIRANCEYPGRWKGEIQRVEQGDGITITVTHVYTEDASLSFHVTSFIKTAGGKISGVDEYWGDDAPPPAWRQRLGVGCAIPTEKI